MESEFDRKLKILFLGSWEKEGGAAIAMVRLADGLRKLGHSVTIVSLDSFEFPRFMRITNYLARANRKYEFTILKLNGLIDGLYKSVKWLPLNTVFWINYKKFDIVHIHWINSGFLGLGQVRKIARKKPTVWTLHSFWPFSGPHHHFRNSESKLNKPHRVVERREERVLRGVARNVALWILPSSFMKVRIPPLDLKVIPNVVPVPPIEKISELRDNSIVFACAGDVFDPRKGLVELLEEWLGLPELYENYQLKIVGPLWPHSTPSMLFKDALDKNVEFCGKMSEVELSNYLSKSFATVVPSHEETFGLVMAESIAAGTPVLARSSLGPLSDFEILEKAVYRIEIEANQIIESLNSIRDSGLNRGELSEEILQLFGVDAVAYKHLQAYFSLLQ